MEIEQRVEQLECEVVKLKDQIQILQQEIRNKNITYNKVGRKSKFSENKKSLIYSEWKDHHLSYDQLAKKYDCAKGTIYNIIKQEQHKESGSTDMVMPIIHKKSNMHLIQDR